MQFRLQTKITLTTALLGAVGPTGCLISYELREDFAAAARRNVATFFGDAPNWTIKLRDLYEGFDETGVGQALQAVVRRRAVKPRQVYQPLRVAITGTTVSPGIFESVSLLGREETLRRIDLALAGG